MALGHTADDQVETVLMHIVRGSGLAGLAGMQPFGRRSISGSELLLLRPLLAVTREDTLAYCRALGLEPRFDESNRSPDMTRNRVRMELMPLLQELNPQARNAILRLAAAARHQISHLDEQVASPPPQRHARGRRYRDPRPEPRSHAARRRQAPPC